MRAGLLRHRLAVQAPSESRGNFGSVVQSWSTVVTRWGSIEPLRGAEMERAATIKADLTHKITMRYYSALTPKMRVVNDGRAFNVEHVFSTFDRERDTVAYCTQDVDVTVPSPQTTSELLDTQTFDATATGETTLISSSGQASVPVALVFRVASISGASSDPTVKIGTNVDNDNILLATKLTGLRTMNTFYLPLAGAAEKIGIGDDLKVEVTGAATATTYTVTLDVVGYEQPS